MIVFRLFDETQPIDGFAAIGSFIMVMMSVMMMPWNAPCEGFVKMVLGSVITIVQFLFNSTATAYKFLHDFNDGSTQNQSNLHSPISFSF